MIHHIELYVSNLSESKAFWGWLLEDLGYALYQEWDEGFSYKQDHSYVVFVQVEQRFLEEGYHRKRIGLNHLAFFGRSRLHIDELTTTLKDRGTRLLYQNTHPYAGGDKHYAVYFEDPDRIKVEVVAP
ncbi:VOC family protein [Alkalicoccobacillus gibsonii]|jgi:catechol 2,3-dioxygenase-like lactoylglutathione lyase family enzyme|uniref:VOC family protein n=1 Tax=Alkalicoccobacillus gibsonii TaxID=79881 RepID=A0ABU9VF84_9BACI